LHSGRDKTTRRANHPKPCPALYEKIFRLSRRANQRPFSARLTRQEGRLAIVTDVAVGCGGRESCD
jgi:hypothetical protein